MAAVIDLFPTTRIDAPSGGTEHYQSIEDAVDVSGYTEVGVLLTAYAGTVASSIVVSLETAVDNRDDGYVKLKELKNFSGPATISGPDKTYMYMHGAGEGGSSAFPGFARYLRLHVSIPEQSDWISLGVKAVLKP